MAGNRICITTDCVCDLPDDMLKKNEVELVYFYITTDSGRFKDVAEITAQNVFEYLAVTGGKTTTEAPPKDEFLSFFNRKLKEYDEIIHIAISSGVSKSYENAMQAVEEMGDMGKQVHVVDSWHLSTGIGHLVLRAAEMARSGADSKQIIDEMTEMRNRVSSSFMADNADYLYRNAKVTKTVQRICSLFKIHPVLGMKEGQLKLKSFHIGNYEKSAVRYIRSELKNYSKIKNKLLFITHAGCRASDMKLARLQVNHIMKFDEVIVTKASATISGNSGPRTFGLLYIKEE